MRNNCLNLFSRTVMSSENGQTKRHYTPLERKIFLDALSKQMHIIENKESDALRSKEKLAAWMKVASEYNSSPSITRERSVIQLKTLWANIKQGERWNLTNRKQWCLATGSGPAEPPAVMDPDIAAIPQHLMMTIPLGFSSSIEAVPKKDMNYHIPMESIPCAEIRMDTAEPQPSTPKAAFDMNLRRIDRSEEELLPTPKLPANTGELFGCTRSSSQVMQSPPAKKARLTSCGRSIATNSSHGGWWWGDHEKELREERVRRLMEHDEELAGIRRTQELELWKIKVKHVNEICNLEIRAAQAKAELAELELQLAISR